jgi:hypothetical protein
VAIFTVTGFRYCFKLLYIQGDVRIVDARTTEYKINIYLIKFSSIFFFSSFLLS